MNIAVLGPAPHPSPLKRWVDDSERVPATIVRTVDARLADDLLFELAGARQNLFFNPPENSRRDCYLRSIVSRAQRCNPVAIFRNASRLQRRKGGWLPVGYQGWIRNTAQNLWFSHTRVGGQNSSAGRDDSGHFAESCGQGVPWAISSAVASVPLRNRRRWHAARGPGIL